MAPKDNEPSSSPETTMVEVETGSSARLLLCSVLVATWLGLLLTGLLPSALSHLVLIPALVAFPWRR